MTLDMMEDYAEVENEVSQYMRQIRRFPRLTPQQERELARRCAQGDEDAIRTMVDCNLRLVVSMAREYVGRGVPLMDLVQEGSIGLIVAAKKFDPDLEYRFSTYATKWIRQGITMCLLNPGLIRVPVHTAEKMKKVQYARSELLLEMGCEPTAEQIGQRLGLSGEKVAQLLRLEPQICSLDAPAGDGDEGSLVYLMEDPLAAQPYDALVREELIGAIDALMEQLNDRQRQVLRLRFGLEDGVCHSLEQTGRILGISKERARQVEKAAMDKLRAAGKDMGLEEFLE